MRHQPKPVPSFLQVILAAVPVEALRELVLDLLQNGAAETAPAAVDPPRRAAKRRGRPKGTGGRRGPGRPPKASAPAETTAARRKRNEWRRKHYAELQQAKRAKQAKLAERAAAKAKAADRGNAKPKKGRAAVKEAKAVKGKQIDHGNGANGQAKAKPEITPAQLWAHAARISPKTPWKAVARELGANEVQARDCFRAGTMIPGIAAIAAARFCELPA